MAVNTLISPTEPMIKPWDVCPSNGLKKKKASPVVLICTYLVNAVKCEMSVLVLYPFFFPVISHLLINL